MSNEVNQAFLRAYVKNRADRALQGTNQPTASNASASGNPSHVRRDIPNQGGAIRIDQAAGPAKNNSNPQTEGSSRPVPAPHLLSSVGNPSVGNPSLGKQRAVESLRPNSPAALEPQTAGVWSPLGAERGMKGANRTTSAPAVVVNAPSLESVPNVARMGSRTLTSPTPTASNTSNKTSSVPPVKASQTESASLPSPTRMRIDAAHGVQKRPHASEIVVSASLVDAVQVAPSVVIHDHLNGLRNQIHTSIVMPNAPIMAGVGIATQPKEFLTQSPKTVIPATPLASAKACEPLAVPSTTTNDGSNHQRHDQTKTMPKHGDVHSGAHSPPASKLGPGVANRPAINRDVDRSALDRYSPTTSLPLPVAFSPSWEVDKFLWPDVLVQIQNSDSAAFHAISKHLRLANQDGLKVIAVTSGERGVGRSTIAMHLARCAAASGLKVALVDADGFYPSLIDQFKLDLEHGWQDCLFENIPLEEVAVKSIEDNITLFPLTSVISMQQLHVNLHRMAKVVKRISLAYDMVFLDSNRLNLEQRDLVGISQESVIDAAIVVTDSELSIKEKVDTAVSILHGMGIASVGIVRNFHS